MKFTYLEELGISTELKVFERSSQSYTALLYQHEGNLCANEHAIRNSTNVASQLNAFLSTTREQNPDIAFTPEYSCPWTVVRSIINDENLWPANKKLWAFGCESITKDQLRNFADEHTSENIWIYYDLQVLTKNNNFVDPLVYFFKGRHMDKEKLIVLVQFKTKHMGAWGGTNVERDNLIEGEEIYVLRNSCQSIHFFSLICSEAINFQGAMNEDNVAKLDWIDKPYLIFNPQMNPKPTHSEFSDFKKYILSEDRKELIVLNWANTSKLEGKDLLTDRSTRSGFWIKSHEINCEESRIKTNHRLGMYYFHLQQQKHAFVLNSLAHAYLIDNLPVHIKGVQPVQSRRDGPRIRKTFSLNIAKSALIERVDGISDQHLPYLIEVGCTSGFLNNTETCILQKEKIVSLTSGNIPKKHMGASWHKISNLYAFKSEEQTEVNHRITFTEDNYPTSRNQRERYLNAIRELDCTVFVSPHLFPESIRDLKGRGLKIGYAQNASQNDYRYNVVDENGNEIIATICFMGIAPSDMIEKAFNAIQDIFDRDNMNRRRVVIFFRKGNEILCKHDPQAGRISETNTYDNESILK